jgi:hypothetical protein
MNTNKRQKYLQTGLALAISLLLWNPLPVSSFPQHGGDTGTGGGDRAGGITMQTVSGKVVETMNAGGYTYALVDKDGAKTWVALPMSMIAVGDEITCRPGMIMNNFRSTSLNRSFEQIVFSGGITSTSGDAVHPDITPAEVSDMPKTKEPKNWKDF